VRATGVFSALCCVTGGSYPEGKTIADLVKECEGHLQGGYTGIKINIGSSP